MASTIQHIIFRIPQTCHLHIMLQNVTYLVADNVNASCNVTHFILSFQPVTDSSIIAEKNSSHQNNTL